MGEPPSLEERVFAILTAKYHGDDTTAHLLITELDASERDDAIGYIAALVRGLVTGIELRADTPPGEGMAALAAHFRALRVQ